MPAFNLQAAQTRMLRGQPRGVRLEAIAAYHEHRLRDHLISTTELIELFDRDPNRVVREWVERIGPDAGLSRREKAAIPDAYLKANLTQLPPSGAATADKIWEAVTAISVNPQTTTLDQVAEKVTGVATAAGLLSHEIRWLALQRDSQLPDTVNWNDSPGEVLGSVLSKVPPTALGTELATPYILTFAALKAGMNVAGWVIANLADHVAQKVRAELPPGLPGFSASMTKAIVAMARREELDTRLWDRTSPRADERVRLIGLAAAVSLVDSIDVITLLQDAGALRNKVRSLLEHRRLDGTCLRFYSTEQLRDALVYLLVPGPGRGDLLFRFLSKIYSPDENPNDTPTFEKLRELQSTYFRDHPIPPKLVSILSDEMNRLGMPGARTQP